jgi:hypothetical protein
VKPFTATIGNATPVAPAAAATPAAPAPPAAATTPQATAQKQQQQQQQQPRAQAPSAAAAAEPAAPTVKAVPAEAAQTAAAADAVPPAAATGAASVAAAKPTTAAATAPAGGRGSQPPPPPPSASQQQQQQQSKKKGGGGLSKLFVLLVGGTGAVLAGLKFDVDTRDYADLHFPSEMARLRQVLPAGFLPAASSRSVAGRVGKSLGLVETVDADLNHAVADANKQLDKTIADVNGQLRGATRQVDAAQQQAGQRIDEVRRQIGVQVDGATKSLEESVVKPVRAAVDSALEGKTPWDMTDAEKKKQATTEGKDGASTAAAAVTERIDSLKSAASSAVGSARKYLESQVSSAGAGAVGVADPELRALLRELAAAEEDLITFTHEQEQNLRAELARAEAELKDRGEQRLWSLEQHQRHTLDVLAERQQRRIERAHAAQTDPRREEFERQLRVDEENKWRRRLYLALEEINEQLSEGADQAIQDVESSLQRSYATEGARLEREAAQKEVEVIRPLQAALEAARHRQLRSAQAHRLSAALLELQELVDRDRVSLAGPWAVVQSISAEDYTLRQAVSAVDALSIERGVLSLKALKDVFAQWLAPELKVATFMPDHEDIGSHVGSSVLRQVLARLFAAATANEAGGLILAPPLVDPARASSAPSLAAARRESEAANQAADYAHYINASTFLASNAPDLALAELKQLHPSRRSEQLEAFMRELHRSVQVHKAVAVVKMRVLAINNFANDDAAAAATNKAAKRK